MPRRSRLQQRMFEKKLFYGDNLRILRMPEHFPSESVDLVYLDPPFKPNEQYNVLFRDRGTAGSPVPSASQVRAFEDTWQWGPAARAAFNDVKENSPHEVRKMVESLHKILGFSNMFAYLTMMAPRLVELHRVLKSTGSIYLHCDPSASHYLKVLLDAVFGPENFRNEIAWRRTNARSAEQRWPRVHDTILFYGKTSESSFNPILVEADVRKMPHTLITGQDGLKYQTYELTGAGTRNGETGQPWRGFDPTEMGRHWATRPSNLEGWDAEGLIHWPSNGGFPRRRAAEPFTGKRRVVVGDVWTDIDRLNQAATERLGYPTQKPEELLERIIRASCNEGDVVLDPFCGCGTTIAAAEKMGRYWLGIDVTYDAIPIIRGRLADSGLTDGVDFDVWGSPETAEDAAKLASEDPYQFQWWAVRRLNGKEIERKKGADKGVDGRITLIGDAEGRFPEAVVSVKAGQTGPVHVRELVGTVQAQKGVEVGVLVILRPPTKAMREAAEAAGGYPGVGGGWCPRIQILTAEDIINNVGVKAPSSLPVRAGVKEGAAEKGSRRPQRAS